MLAATVTPIATAAQHVRYSPETPSALTLSTPRPDELRHRPLKPQPMEKPSPLPIGKRASAGSLRRLARMSSGFVVHAGDGQAAPGAGGSVLATAAATDGTFSLLLSHAAAGDGAPLHVHRHESESFFVLAGTYRIQCGDETSDAGVDTLVLNYRNQAGGLVNEVLTFDGDLVCQGHGTYLGSSAQAGGAPTPPTQPQ